MACEHPKNAMEWVKEGVMSGVVRCKNCNTEFEVKGWLNRGAGSGVYRAAIDGFGSGVVRGGYNDLKGKN